MTKILVTGFDPFGGNKINPAIEAVKRLPDGVKGAEVVKLEIPIVFSKSAGAVKEVIEKKNSDYVLNVGQVGGHLGLTPERIAISINDGRIPDSGDYRPLDEPIHKDGEAAYFTQLPVKVEAKAIRDTSLSASVLDTAGTYVCNHIIYQIQYMGDEEFPNIKAGSIHVPFLPERVVNRSNTPSMALGGIAKGLTAAPNVIVGRDGKGDIEAIEGANH